MTNRSLGYIGGWFAALRAWWNGLERGDRLAVALLIVLPIVIYLPFSLAGHPVMPGDDGIQNYPLRVLSGDIIRSGRLPAWNPLIWSGTPLLAGWNAGAMFPGTWLFAILPGIAAWTVNFIGTMVIASLGMYALLRQFRCSPIVALLGGLIFTYTGFMAGQAVHIGLTQGTAILPWMLLGVEGLTRATTHRRALGPMLLVAASFVSAILAGDPRGATTAAITVVLYGLACSLRRDARLVDVLTRSTVGVVLGAGLAAVQLLPGLQFLHASQRGQTAIAFFGAGSITLPHLAGLFTEPFLIGANGNFGLPVYIGTFNLPEVTVGSGIVALIAAFVYLPEFFTRVRDVVRERVAGRLTGVVKRPLVVWYLMMALGVVLVLGADTPLGKVLVKIPLYGHERLQNRNAALIDLALAVLVGFLVDDLWPRSPRAPAEHAARSRFSLRGASHGPLTPLARMLGLVPVALTCVFGLALFVKPYRLEHYLHTGKLSPRLFVHLAPIIVAPMVIAALAGIALLLAPGLRAASARVVFAAIAVCDVGFYMANASYAGLPASVLGGATPLSTQLHQLTGEGGRSALYDPSLLSPSGDPQTLASIGVTDLNILRDNRSAQGYGSIVDGTYQTATNTHAYQDLNPGPLVGETYNTLDLRDLLTLPIYFGTAIPSGAPIPLPGGGSTANPSHKLVPPGAPNPSGPWTIKAAARQSWLLQTPLHTTRATLVLNPAGPAVARLTVGIAIAGGPVSFQTVPVTNGEAQVRFGSGTVANELVIENPGTASISIDAVVVISANPGLRTLLDGSLQGFLNAPHWRYVGLIGPFSVFANSETRGLAWLQPATSKTPDTATITNGSVDVTSLGGTTPEQMTVRSPGAALLVRSETYSPGWTARLAPVGGGPTIVLAAHRFGLVQEVDIPKGNFVVTWKYAPTQLTAGVLISGISLLVFLCGCVFAWRQRRARAVTA